MESFPQSCGAPTIPSATGLESQGSGGLRPPEAGPLGREDGARPPGRTPALGKMGAPPPEAGPLRREDRAGLRALAPVGLLQYRHSPVCEVLTG